MSRPRIRPAAFACVLLSLLLSACSKDEIVTYRVVTGPAAPAAAGAPPPSATPAPPPPSLDAIAAERAAMSSAAVSTASGPGLAWTAPAAWKVGPENRMRKATLLIPGEGGAVAELAVTAFPGDVGGNLANVNRWRQQLGLAPITQAELGPTLQRIEVGPLQIDLAELVGAGSSGSQRVLGAIVRFAGATWFFKVTGPEALVAQERPAIIAFLQTLRPQG